MKHIPMPHFAILIATTLMLAANAVSAQTYTLYSASTDRLETVLTGIAVGNPSDLIYRP